MANLTESPKMEAPKGWTKQVTQRQIGKTLGKFDLYFYSPSGKKLRSKKEIGRYINENNLKCTLSQFDFTHKETVNAKTPTTSKNITPFKKKSLKSPMKHSSKKKSLNKNKDCKIKVKMNFPFGRKRKISLSEDDEPILPIKKTKNQNTPLKAKSNTVKKSIKFIKTPNKKSIKIAKKSISNLKSTNNSVNTTKEILINSSENQMTPTPRKRGRPKKIIVVRKTEDNSDDNEVLAVHKNKSINNRTDVKPFSPETYVDDDLKVLKEASVKFKDKQKEIKQKEASNKQILDEVQLIEEADRLRYQKDNLVEESDLYKKEESDLQDEEFDKRKEEESTKSNSDDDKEEESIHKEEIDLSRQEPSEENKSSKKQEGNTLKVDRINKIDHLNIIPILEKTMMILPELTSNISEKTKTVLDDIILIPVGSQITNTTGKRERKKPTWMKDNQYETGDPLAKIKEIGKTSPKLSSPKKSIKLSTPISPILKTSEPIKINSDIKNSSLYKTLKSPLKPSKIVKIPKTPKSSIKETSVESVVKKKRGRPKKNANQAMVNVPSIGEYSDINSFQPSLQPPINLLSEDVNQLNESTKHHQEMLQDSEFSSIYLDHCYSSSVIAERLEPLPIENNLTIPATDNSHVKQSPRTTKAIAQAASEYTSSGCARVLPAKSSSNRARKYDSYTL